MSFAPCDFAVLLDDCTSKTCCLAQGTVNYVPTLAGNTLFLVIFSILNVFQLALSIRFRTWSFLVGTFFGLLCEIIGYAGRVWMHANIFSFNAFLVYLIPVTLGPAFLSASIYLSLSRIINAYGRDFSPLAPRTYTVLFVSCDILSLVLQGTGGTIAAVAVTASDYQQSLSDTGVNIMIAGLSFQVFSLTLFIMACAGLGWSIHKSSGQERNPEAAGLRQTKLFQGFVGALAIATVFIYIRCCYRVAELSGGFGGHLANDEVTFMVLEGPMIIIAVVAITVFHPGLCLGGFWRTNSSKSNKGSVDRVPSS